ncbi:MAG: hypothetical protein IKX03_05035 [Bacteroidales bacterium]|nr:hypothetical protein [Bacteroidales bacterium]
MRKTILTFVLTAAALLSTGCNQDNWLQPEQGRGFTALLEEQADGTRTTLDGAQVLWSAGDSIQVFKLSEAGTGGYSGVRLGLLSEDDGKATGHFPTDNCPDYETAACVAVYPASAARLVSSSKISVSLPAEQYYRDGSFDLNSNPAVAKSDGSGKLMFKNLCGLLAVYVSSDTEFSEIRITSKADEALWGEGTFDLSYSDVPVFSIAGSVAEEQRTLTLKARPSGASSSGSEWLSATTGTVSGSTFSGTAPKAVPYYFVVPAGALSKGFTVTLVGKDGAFMQKEATSAKNAIERSVCTSMPNLDFADESAIVIRTDVPNKAFYKDVFSDAGILLTQNGVLPVVSYLGISFEYYKEREENNVNLSHQRAIFCGSDEDENGYLLYPDGAPRFRMFYVNGGQSSAHGLTLGNEGRENIRKFVRNGGSYEGHCAGAYLSTTGVYNSGYAEYSLSFFGLWPGIVYRTSLQDVYPNYVIPEGSPLLKYYDFGGDRYVVGVKHANGPYFADAEIENVEGTEILARFDFPDGIVHGHASIIAYKPSIYSGRIIPCGGHPEYAESGEVRDLMAAMYKYAFDGVGIARIKGILHNGQVRRMTKSTSDNDPDFTKIGDRQCHHFAFALPAGARNIKVRLEALQNFNLSLRMAEGTFAFKEDAQYSKEGSELVKELTFSSLPKGTWYVGVQCEDTVTYTETDTGVKYSDTAVLNGVPYTISVTWDI